MRYALAYALAGAVAAAAFCMASSTAHAQQIRCPLGEIILLDLIETLDSLQISLHKDAELVLDVSALMADEYGRGILQDLAQLASTNAQRAGTAADYVELLIQGIEDMKIIMYCQPTESG